MTALLTSIVFSRTRASQGRRGALPAPRAVCACTQYRTWPIAGVNQYLWKEGREEGKRTGRGCSLLIQLFIRSFGKCLLGSDCRLVWGQSMTSTDTIPALGPLTFWWLQTIVMLVVESAMGKGKAGRAADGVSGLQGGGFWEQAATGRGRGRSPGFPAPSWQMWGCCNCGQPRLPNATTAASLRAGRAWRRWGRGLGGRGPHAEPTSGPSHAELGQRPPDVHC